jgi:glycine/D-amino acid oxidase-like deaminating enzyme
MSYDVVIVGGGIVGVSTAFHCVREGLRTVLLDRLDAGRATDAGAGILSPETSAGVDVAWARFATTAVRYYDRLLHDLRGEDGNDTGYAQCGLILVAASDDEMDAYEAAAARIFQRQRESGWPLAQDLHELTAEQAREKFPPLAHVRRALFSRMAARMDGRLFTSALLRAAQRRGLVVERAGVDSLHVSGGCVRGVVSLGRSYDAPAVVIAGGAWSKLLSDQLGVPIGVEPQRGQIIHLQLNHAGTDRWTIVNAFHGHYIVPRPGGRIVVGATRETGSGFDPRLTAAGVREVLAEALRVAPGLAPAGVHEMRVGLRPLSSDMAPILGPVPGLEGAYLATGHGPAGLQLGPYSGKLVCDLLKGRQPDLDLTPFRVARFASGH